VWITQYSIARNTDGITPKCTPSLVCDHLSFRRNLRNRLSNPGAGKLARDAIDSERFKLFMRDGRR